VQRLVRPIRLEDLSRRPLKTCPATTSSIATLLPIPRTRIGWLTARGTWSGIGPTTAQIRMPTSEWEASHVVAWTWALGTASSEAAGSLASRA
jgi:hypothetical protein